MKKANGRSSRPVALVTGGASPLGSAISRRLALEGYALAVHFGNSPLRAAALQEEIKGRGGVVRLFRMDLSMPEGAGKLVRKAVDAFGRLDLLVNNASVFTPTPVKGRLSDWLEVFNINLFSPYFLCREALPLLRKAKGSVVNLADIYGEHPILRDHPAYCSSKAGLIALTRWMAGQWGPEVRVNAVAPGAITLPPGYGAAQKLKLMEKSPLKRFGTPGEIAHAVWFLASNSFVTGQVLSVDGGRFL